jgi:ATP-dependent DNA helicase UvrD/PcrA
MNRLTEKLNPSQLEAVTTTEGPLLIVAGAGSGKTRALTTRVAHILSERLAEPRQILAVTFTNKAASEMTERVSSMLGTSPQALTISTFHAFCARLLRRECEKIGFPRNFVIHDTDDSKTLLKRCLEELNFSGNQFTPVSLRATISNAKNGLMTAQEFAERASGYFETRTAEVYSLYDRRMRIIGAMDFDDLILHSVRLLQGNEDVREKYRSRFRYLMVDEYQDTNHSQYLLLRALTGSHNNICVVGDEDQSIYGWRGADIRNIRDFERDFPGAKVVTLNENYRSTQIILNAAGSVIANNKNRKEKRLHANVAGSELVTLIISDTPETEAALITDSIVDRTSTCSLKDMVILYRTVAQSRALENALIQRKIAYQVIGSKGFYQLKEIRDLISYLKLISNPNDDIAFERAIGYPKRGFGGASLAKLQLLSRARGKSLFATATEDLAAGTLADTLNARPLNSLCALLKLVEEFKSRADSHSDLASATHPDILAEPDTAPDPADTGETITTHGERVDTLIQDLILAIGIEEEIKKDAEDEIKARSRIDNVDELVSAAVEFTAHSADSSLSAFLEQVSLYTNADAYKDVVEKLTLMTIHAAKGLEFEAVFIVGLEEGLFPLNKAMDEPNEMEEERRLFYVAATRAKQKLTLSAAQNRFRYGSVGGSPSRFISEIDSELLNTIDRRTYVRDATTSESNGVNFDGSGWSQRTQSVSGANSSADSGYEYEYEEEEMVRPGRIVQHRVFGRGKVVTVEGRGENMRIVAHFSGVGKKTLIAKYAKLKIVG